MQGSIQIPTIKPDFNKAHPKLGVGTLAFSPDARYVYTRNGRCMMTWSHGLSIYTELVNALRPKWSRQCFTDIFKCIFFNENVWILIKFSLKFVPEGPIYNIPTLVQILAWCRVGDNPLFRADYLYTFCIFCTQKWQYEICTLYTGIYTHKINANFYSCLT